MTENGEAPAARTLLRPFGPMSLRFRLFGLLIALMLVTMVGAGYTLYYAFRTQSLFENLESAHITPLMAAQSLEGALSMQSGYFSSYLLEHDDSWLTLLVSQQAVMEDALARARNAETIEEGRLLLNRIEAESVRYFVARDEVINALRAGNSAEAAPLHAKARDKFYGIRDLALRYKKLHEDGILTAGEEYREAARSTTALVVAALPLTLVFGVWMGFILFKQVLDPIRRLALGDRQSLSGAFFNEVGALSDRVFGLLGEVRKAQGLLNESRETLRQTEKLALVGKLAAGVAHSIRNPLTSVKMRLFSLERTLALTSQQKEDFEVIAAEVKHLDTIVRNFLEFSRRPKLQMQRVSPSDVVDNALTLLRHRLEAYHVDVEVHRSGRLPAIDLDPEQIKEALVNLILNACDAMGGGGHIDILEEKGILNPLGRVVVIRVTDSGPGIPPELQEDIFQPFFSTKAEGTGLGLPIAKRILEEHGGWLHAHSAEGRGASFVMAIPCKEDDSWLRS